MMRRSVALINPILWQAARGFTHLRNWIDYYTGAPTQPSGSPARLIVYASHQPAGGAALETLDRAS